jgi:hypothetical protein
MEIAVGYGRTNIIDLLRKHGVPALEHSVAVQLILIEAAGDKDIPRTEKAIRDGANVNGKNRQGETALIKVLSLPLFATVEGCITINYLLEKGADPAIQGEGRWGRTTALHLAIYWNTPKDSFVFARVAIESLLRHGALVSARDGSGMTPLHIAAKNNNIAGAKILIEAGSKIMPRDDKGKTPLDYAESAEMIRLLKNHGAKEE